MATHVFRSIHRWVLNGGARSWKPMLRHASIVRQPKFISGENNQRIMLSPYGEVSYPEMLIHEFIWSKSGEYPDKIALECGISGKKYTYAQAKDATDYIGRSLRDIGLKQGDVIALIAPNLPDTILSYLGSLSGGLVVSTINPFFTADEISKLLSVSNAKAVITASEIASTVLTAMNASLPPKIPFIVIDDNTCPIPDSSIPFQDLITRGRSLPPVKNNTTSIDDIAILPFSSGSTGLPKAVMLTHRNIVGNIEMVEKISDDTFYPTTDTYQEIIPAVLPFFHIFGMTSVTLSRLAKGGKIVTIPKFVPETFVNVLEKSKATVLFCVPPILLFLSASPIVKKQHLQHLHCAFSGAAPLAKSDVDRFYEKFDMNTSIIKFRQGYGLTESSPVAFVETTGEKFASIGFNVPGSEARLVDITTNKDIDTPGKTGELLIRGPHIMKGYLNNDVATKEAITDDKWLRTGDIAYFDENHLFYIADRLKELIKVKGFQVAPAELEALLRTHPDVSEAAVIGIPHEKCGEVPRAVVALKKGKKASEDDIKNFVRGKVSEYKQLAGGVRFVDEIPKNTSGKIVRLKVKSDHGS